jgi:hypothetical protein
MSKYQTRRFFLEMTFRDDHGHVFARRAIEIDSAKEWMEYGDGNIPPLSRSTFGTTTVDSAVEVLKCRQLRRDDFIKDAKRMGMALADYLEDKEGWHGERRQTMIEELEKKEKG